MNRADDDFCEVMRLISAAARNRAEARNRKLDDLTRRAFRIVALERSEQANELMGRVAARSFQV